LKTDNRLIGETAEHILACLLRNNYGIVAQRFDTEGFDLIAFDPENKFFEGKSPFFIQVKTRGGGNPTGMDSKSAIGTIKDAIEKVKLDESSFYIAVGFFEKDIRGIEFYLIPWVRREELYSKSGIELRFNRRRLESLKFKKI